MMMSGKRSRTEMENTTSIENMAKFLMLLSRSRGDHIEYQSMAPQPTSTASRVYECKTCNRQFPSFQALGGHRASHKKPRLMDQISVDNHSAEAAKPKIHECSICGLQFAIGQALGGHMRRHRAAMAENSSTTAAGLTSSSSDTTTDTIQPHQQVPVFKRSNSSRRILGVNLDLNLSVPLSTTAKDSNDFEFCSLAAATQQMSAPPMIYTFI
ncbi:hypothetical protein MKW94_008148 [Papaver nudicaule]|uniref:C2H2-type domain-containing protein n=1 Tax=Papaver nudicaule TaxID=74823 RepID=A0AA42AW76_PAPNU|nr:hypothetical protein [Papaver nudicaule]